MTLDTNTIKTTLDAASWMETDDKARELIKNATPGELRSLDAEGVLRLFKALAMGRGFYSSADDEAMERLATHSQFQKVTTPDFGVNLVRNTLTSEPTVQTFLTVDLVNRVYAAESKRLAWYEHVVDGSTIGRGQLGEAAYTDVKDDSRLKHAWATCLMHVRLSQKLKNPKAVDYTVFVFDMENYTVKIPAFYRNFVYKDEALEDFVVAGYLALKMVQSTKAGRSAKDAARIAVALYHGMRPMVVKAQTAAGDLINWAPVEAELLAQGHTDEVAYVNEIVP